MHSVNLDLLRTTPHHADGQPKDPHAYHRADLLAAQKSARQARRQALVTRALIALARWNRALRIKARSSD